MDGSARRPTRRDLLTAAGISALALTTGSGFAVRATQASGCVFHDRSGTAQRRAGDPGIGGVMVSNGRDVVTTDADGNWQLPVVDGERVFVIKPRHWSCPPGPDGTPMFYIDPATVPVGLDFPLRPTPERREFEALLLADTQPADAAELAYLRDDILTPALGVGAAFGINHGDIVFDNATLYARYLQMLGASGIAWHHCPGNHDLDYAARDDQGARATWRRTFGPRRHAFQYVGATFIVLDNVYYFGRNPGDKDSGRYCGRIGPEQLQFVRQVLQRVPRDELVVLSMHIPLLTYQDATSASDNTVDRRALLELLGDRPHSVSFAGHMHLTEHHYFGARDGFSGAHPHHHHVLTAASGSWWGGPKDGRGIPAADSQDGTPNGFHVLSVDGARYTTRYVPAPGKSVGQMRVLIEGPDGMPVDGHVGASSAAGCHLVANVFDGGPATHVVYDVAGMPGSTRPMHRVAAPDPYVARLYARTASAQKPWVSPVASSHVWKAPLPGGLAAGAHCLTVHASDEYGRRLRQHLLLEVVDDRRTV